MKRLAVVAALLLTAPGCVQVQLNVGSNVVNVTKTQVSGGDSTMAGSKLEDVARDISADGTVTPGG